MKILALDHIVLNVADVDAAARFYCDVLGLPGERFAEFRDGTAPFPSVRVSPQTIIDLFPPAMHAGRPRGENVNHIAFDVDGSPDDIEAFLERHAIAVIRRSDNAFGARGAGTASFYVNDPDGNVIELRTYHG